MGDALTFAAAAQAPEFFKALARRGRDGPDGRLLIPVTARVAEHYARGGPVDSIGSVLAIQGEMKPAVRNAIISGLAKGWPRDKTPKLDADAERAITSLLPALSPEARGQMLGARLAMGRQGARTVRRRARQRLPRRRLRRVEARMRPASTPPGS